MIFSIITIVLISISWADTSVISLSDVQHTKVSELTRGNNLLIAFQPDCSSCKKQIKDLSCLDKDYKISLIGIASSEQALRKEYRKLRTPYPAFYASPQAMMEFGLSDSVTPQILIWKNETPQLFYGYKRCREYKKAFAKENI
ncbi:MAG: hypothetical protein HRT44_08665 [Bdellovibrionales bacterium]|nr:hypothetical protein [Bdellovibrionales bacterium]NQZ19312.1 hypothetical protein [Bdellovibrionales bacterium]